MTPWLSLLPFAMLLVILPFPGTVAARLLLLAICFAIAQWRWWLVPGVRAAIPCKAVLGVWIAVCLASLTYAFDFAYTLGELKNEIGYTMMAFFAFFAVAHERNNAVWLLRASGLGIVVLGSWALVTLVGNHMAWQEGGGHGGTGVAATCAITVMPGLVWLAREDPSPRGRRLAAGICGFTLFFAVMTMQRAIWPVLALQAILLLTMAARAGLFSVPRRHLLAAAIVLAVTTVAGIVQIQQARYGGAVSDDPRLAFWPRVVARIVEHPLAGTGFGRGVIHQAYPDLTPAEAPALWHGHNVFLNYGLEMGLPGIVALVALFAGLGSMFWRASSGPTTWAGIAGLMLVAGVLARNQFNDFFGRDMSIMFWAFTGLFARLAVPARQGRQDDQQTPA